MMAQWRLERLLAHAGSRNLPVLFLVGEKDRTVPPSVSKNAAAQLHSAEFRAVPDTGHLLHEECPEVVVAEAEQFLKAVM